MSTNIDPYVTGNDYTIFDQNSRIKNDPKSLNTVKSRVLTRVTN